MTSLDNDTVYSKDECGGLYLLPSAVSSFAISRMLQKGAWHHPAALILQVRIRYEKVLEEVNKYVPRYMEEMESVFDQSQDEERKRIVFLKEAFLSIHKHLDITNNEWWAAAFCL